MTADKMQGQPYLTALLEALEAVARSEPVTTPAFAACCAQILPFFDHLGPVFYVAKGEFQRKLESLAGCTVGTLQELVQADVKAGKATIKGSTTRNLHRLMAAIQFTRLLFERLAKNPGTLLREAASEAYEASLAPFHTAIIRGVVRASMITLPSREHFLASMGETEESALAKAHAVTAAATKVAASVGALFGGIEMPASDVWLWPSS